MEPVAERPSSGWWVAATIPGKTLKFAENLGAEHYLPKVSNRPVAPYVFIRAAGKTNAWMTPGFRGWLLIGSARATVSDAELDEFRSRVEISRVRPAKQTMCRLLRKFDAHTDIRVQ